MLTLSQRLLSISAMVPKGSKTADIGSDHALLPCYLVQTGRAPWVIATDLRPGPLQAARKCVAEFKLEQKVMVRQGDGLMPIKPAEVETVIIAGMGGDTIRQILTDGVQQLEGLTRLVLQPMTAGEETRRWLMNNGWRIVDEDLLKEEGHFYEIIVAEKGCGDLLTQDQVYYGPVLIQKRHPILIERLTRDIREWQEILPSLAKSKSIKARKKETELQTRIHQAKELKTWLLAVEASSIS